MGDNLYRTFALLIGQVLPGMLLVFAFAPHVPALQIWLGAAAEADVTVGSMVLVLFASIGTGLVLSGARFLVFERWYRIERQCDPTGPEQVSRVLPRDAEGREETLHVQHYAYYQFYGSMAIALPIATALTWWVPLAMPVKLVVGYFDFLTA